MRAPFAFIKRNGVWAPTNASVPLMAWYRGDTVTQSLGVVTAWPDISGSGDANRNQNTSSSPTYNATDADYGGKPSVSSSGSFFDSAGAWSVPPNAPITIVVVGKVSAGTAMLSGAGAGSSDLLWSRSGDLEFYNAGFGGVLNGGTPINVPCVMMFEDDGSAGASAARLFVNNLSTPTVSGVTITTSAPELDLMKQAAGVGHLVGSEAEVIIFSGILTPTDKVNLKAYLNTTRAYGIPVT